MHTKTWPTYFSGFLALVNPLSRALVPRERSVSFIPSLEDRTTSACQALYKLMPNQTFFPDSSQYITEATHVWSMTCVLKPNCVFEPATAENLSAGLKIIKKAKTRFAVRSGGHMPVPGAQSVDNGVMISLSGFSTKKLRRDHAIAELGSGNLWIDVYNYLATYGLAANGGRYPTVGVGGLLLGGGIGYFSGRQGWGCDNVVGYEVVLADGRIVYVTAKGKDKDLFWALKGGSNNFGIVTRFDVRVFPATTVYGGITTWTGQKAGSALLSAVDSYIAPGGGVEDPDTHITPFIGVVPANGSSSVTYSNLIFYPGINADPLPLANFTGLTKQPWTNSIISNGVGVQDSWIRVADQLGAFATTEDRDMFATFGYRADPRAIRLHNSTVIEGALRELSHVEGLTIYAAYQPISKVVLEASRRAAPGGNVLGLDPKTDDTFIIGRIDAIWSHEKDDEAVFEFVTKTLRILEKRLRALELWTGFVYLNDAAKNQHPFKSYAGGKNLPRLREVQARYDPEGFLKRYLQHGFPID